MSCQVTCRHCSDHSYNTASSVCRPVGDELCGTVSRRRQRRVQYYSIRALLVLKQFVRATLARSGESGDALRYSGADARDTGKELTQDAARYHDIAAFHVTRWVGIVTSDNHGPVLPLRDLTRASSRNNACYWEHKPTSRRDAYLPACHLQRQEAVRAMYTISSQVLSIYCLYFVLDEYSDYHFPLCTLRENVSEARTVLHQTESLVVSLDHSEYLKERRNMDFSECKRTLRSRSEKYRTMDVLNHIEIQYLHRHGQDPLQPF